MEGHALKPLIFVDITVCRCPAVCHTIFPNISIEWAPRRVEIYGFDVLLVDTGVPDPSGGPEIHAKVLHLDTLRSSGLDADPRIHKGERI